MAVSLSDVDICNLALGLCGARSTITSFADNTPSANAAALWYDRDRLYMLRAYRWNFARFQGPLTLLATAPGVDAQPATGLPWPFMPWAYAYALPDNIAKFNFILPVFNGVQQVGAGFGAWNGNMGPGWIVPFTLASYQNPSDQTVEAIFTNQTIAYGVWTRDITAPGLFDSMFVEAFATRLAGSMSMQLSGLSPLVQALYAKAEAIVMQAQAASGNEGTHTMNTTPDWLRARGSGGGGYFGNDWGWENYGNGGWNGWGGGGGWGF